MIDVMNGILFIDFSLVACDFLKFNWFEMLNSEFLIQHLVLENDCYKRAIKNYLLSS